MPLNWPKKYNSLFVKIIYVNGAIPAFKMRWLAVLLAGNLKLLEWGKTLSWLKRNLLCVTPLLALMSIVHDAQSAVLIDNFATAQSVLNGSTGPVNIGSSQLNNLTRTITASASSDEAETKVEIKNSFLNISNDSDSSGTASIFYSFNATDLTSVADGLLLKISFIDLSAEIQLVANETSVFGFASLGAEHLYEVDFAQFSNPMVFTNLTSLRLNFRGAQSWDARFGSLTANSKDVPEPSTFLLLALGMAILAQTTFANRGVNYANAS